MSLSLIAIVHADASWAQSIPPSLPAPPGYTGSNSRGVVTGVLVGAGLLAVGVLIGVIRSQQSGATEPLPPPSLAPSEPNPPIQTVRHTVRTHRHTTNPPNGPSGPNTPTVERYVPPRPGFTPPNPDERRYVANEILLAVQGDIPPAELRRLETRYRLSLLAETRINLLDMNVRRYRIAPGRTVPRVIRSLGSSPSFVASAEPNYLYELQDNLPVAQNSPAPAPVPVQNAPASLPPSTPAAPSPAAATPERAPQYAVKMLKIEEAHRMATGTDVLVAVIDTGLDETNPEIQGRVADRFDAIGGTFAPLAHGTAMGGVIVAHKDLMGIAPGAKLLAIRAFTNQSNGGNGTGFDILRGLDYAAGHGARIINMSFAGPEDPLLRDALAAARKSGMVEIAAAGNAGDTKPLYPAANTGVIAVTATDASDKVFAKASRGPHVALAAPGVNIIAPGVGTGVQFTSGTSVATAHVAGIAAMLLQAKARATPDDVRKLMSSTARHLPADQLGAGAGVVDANAALAATH